MADPLPPVSPIPDATELALAIDALHAVRLQTGVYGAAEPAPSNLHEIASALEDQGRTRNSAFLAGLAVIIRPAPPAAVPGTRRRK